MRLGQLSRKLGRSPSDILEFLKKNNPDLESGPNTRLSDEQVLQAIRNFDPSMEASIIKEQDSSQEVTEIADTTETAPTVEPEKQESPEMPADAPVEFVPEVIRAPKQELPGLKVVGKIEIKDPRKKEVAPPSEQEGQQQTQQSDGSRVATARTQRSAAPVRRDKPQREWKNPLEMQRQREAEERKEKRQQEIQQAKERRTQKYLSKVKSTPTKPVRRQEESVVEPHVETKPEPKTWLGKIARWLTT